MGINKHVSLCKFIILSTFCQQIILFLVVPQRVLRRGGEEGAAARHQRLPRRRKFISITVGLSLFSDR